MGGTRAAEEGAASQPDSNLSGFFHTSSRYGSSARTNRDGNFRTSHLVMPVGGEGELTPTRVSRFSCMRVLRTYTFIFFFPLLLLFLSPAPLVPLPPVRLARRSNQGRKAFIY